MANVLLKSVKFPDLEDTYIIGDESLSVSGAAADAKATGDALATKADANGDYDNLTAGNAKQLISNVKVNDQTPYVFRTSGGSVDIGDREYVNGIVGGTVAWNQLYNKTGNASGNGVTFTNVNGTITVTGVATGDNWYTLDTSAFPANHKYLLMGGNSASLDSTASMYAKIGDGVYNRLIGGKTACIVSPLLNVSIQARTGYDGDTNPLSFTPQVFDLTQLFGSTIADYIYSLETANEGAGVAWFKKYFPKPYYAYNAGELKSVEGLVSHDMTGFNQLGGSFVSGKKWNSGTYEDGSTNQAANSFKAKCLPNTQYCFCMPQITSNIGYYRTYFDADGTFITKTSADGINSTAKTALFTTPSNAYYVAIDLYRSGGFTATELEKACLNIAWDNSRNGEYEPYELHSYPLDNVTLRGIPKLDANNNLYYDGDVYEPDGTVTRKYGIVDLGTLTWNYFSSYNYFSVDRSSIPNNMGFQSYGYNTIGNISCSKYPTDKWADITSASKDKFIALQENYFGIKDTAYTSAQDFTTAMSGVYLVYELATPTTESADPYQQTQIVNDFGTEEYVFGDSAFPIPVGHNTDYPINVLSKVEMAPNSPDGDGDYIVRQTNGMNEYVPLVIEDALPTIPSTEGSYKLIVTVAEGSDPVLSWVSNA